MVVAYNGSLDQNLPKANIKKRSENTRAYNSKNTNNSGLASESMETLESHKGNNQVNGSYNMRQQDLNIAVRGPRGDQSSNL